jgi:hypothetical protein
MEAIHFSETLTGPHNPEDHNMSLHCWRIHQLTYIYLRSLLYECICVVVAWDSGCRISHTALYLKSRLAYKSSRDSENTSYLNLLANDRWLRIPTPLHSLCWFSLIRFMCRGMQERQVFDSQENSHINNMVRVCCQNYYIPQVRCILGNKSTWSQYRAWYYPELEIKIAAFLAMIPCTLVGG